jgi:hypothetical protein
MPSLARRRLPPAPYLPVEPAINPSLTEQAIGRSWRMGQRREVHVKHLVVANSIESNILKLIEAGGVGGQRSRVGEKDLSAGGRRKCLCKAPTPPIKNNLPLQPVWVPRLGFERTR